MIGKYYTRDGVGILVSNARKCGSRVAYTIGRTYPMRNEQTQGAEFASYVKNKIDCGEWVREPTKEFLKGEETLKTAFATYQKGRGEGTIGGETTFRPANEGKIWVESMKECDKAAGLDKSKIGTIKNLPIVLVAIAIGVLGYFLFGRQKP